MTFPPRDVIESHQVWFDVMHVRHAIAERRPELKDLLDVPDRTLSLVRVPVRGGWVIAGRSYAGAWPVWLVSDPHLNESVWPVDVATSVIVDEFLVRLDRFTGDGPVRPLPTPWRWNQSEASAAVRLADMLAAAQFKVDGVVGHDRGLAYLRDRNTELLQITSAFGDAVRIDLEQAIVTLARKPTLGWVMDVDDLLTVRRMSLTELLSGVAAREPGLKSEDLSHLVVAVDRLVDLLPLPFAEEATETLSDSEDPVAAGAAWWLNQYGYPGAHTVWERPGLDVVQCDVLAVDIRRSQRIASIGDVQRSAGIASVSRKRLAVFSASGFTSSASRWADEAAIMLFTISRDGQHAFSSSGLASEHIPATLGGKHILRSRRLT